MKESVLALPFDQYQRYRLVADLLPRLRADGPPLRVLDVGGRTAVLREFVADARIDLVDVETSDAKGLVLGDGSRLPFKDGAFDVVCAFDTLEHVPPRLRKAFVAECARVARRWVILAGPYASPRVAEAEELLQRFLETKLGERHRYLDEHVHHGLPDRADVEAQFAALGARTLSIGHGNLDRWLVLQCLSMYMDYDAALRGIGADFQRFYNASLYASDHAEPVYRHVVIAALGGAPLPKLDGMLQPPAAPQNALRVTFDLAAELVHFDRERAHWREERAAFQKAVTDLTHDLEGHRAALQNAEAAVARSAAQEAHVGEKAALLRRSGSELQRAFDEQALVLADLRRSNTEHQQVTAEMRRSVDEHKLVTTELQRELAALKEVRDVLERDLAGHKQGLRDLREDLEGHRAVTAELRADIERRQATIGALEADLGGHRRALEETRTDLEGHRKALADARANLDGRRSEIAGLREELAEERNRRRELETSLTQSDSELRRTLALANGLENSLAQREVVYEQLRAELRSRRRNLMRVFRPAK